MIVCLFVIVNQGRAIEHMQDNDLRYRYIRMHGGASPDEMLRLRELFEFDRNPDSIRVIRRQVEKYERLVREQAEIEAKARLNSEKALKLKQEAEKVKN